MQDIGVRVGVQGEQQYRQALQGIVQQSKELNAEMKALVSGFDSTTSAQDQARQKMDVLNREIQNQSKYIETLNAKYKAQESTLTKLKDQLDKANKEYGEGSKESQKLTEKIQQQETAMSRTRTTINNATTALNNMQSEMAQTKGIADGTATATDNLAESIDDVGEAADGASGGWSVFGQMVADFGSRIAGSVLGVIKDLAKEAIGVSDQMIKFKNTMSFAGFSTSEIDSVSKAMKDYADLTVYSLGEVSNVVAQLGANGVENFEELVEAAGNLNAAAGGSADTFSTFGLVLTQTAGAGKLTTENWKQLMNAIPGASGVLQDALRDAGAFVGDFSEAMKDGEITAEEFNEAIMKVGSQPMAQEAATSVETFEGKLGRLKTQGIEILQNALELLMPVIDVAFGALDAFLTPIVNLTRAFKGGKDEIDQYTTSAQTLVETVTNWNDEQYNLDQQFDTSQYLMQNYNDKLRDLSVQMYNAKAAGEDYTAIQLEYSELVRILNETVPDLNLHIDEQTGLLDLNSQSILNNADAWVEAKKKQAWQEAFTDILTKQAQAEAEVETNRVKLKMATDQFNESTERASELQTQLDELWDEFYSGAADDPEELKKQIDAVTKSWEEENLKVKDAQEKMADYTKAVDAGTQALEEISQEVDTARETFDNLMAAQENYGTQTKRILNDEVVPLYARAAKDASDAWNRNISLKVYSPAREGLTTISAYKTGLAYVPYDGFIAELHKGERILTAAEALEYRNLRSPEAVTPSAPTVPDMSTINNNQQTTVTLNVYGAEGQDEMALADIVMDRIQRSVNRQEAIYA